MKVYVLSKYKRFGAEAYTRVYSSIMKKAEQVLRKNYPYCKPLDKTDRFRAYKDNDSGMFFSVKEEEI